MNNDYFFRALAIAFTVIGLSAGTAFANPIANKALVEKAMTAVFVKRDTAAIDRYWGKPYIQHNPGIANGRAALAAEIKQLPPTFNYEFGMVVAEGDLVMLHGRYSGFGPKALVAVDIFRISHGKIVEHWDVLQDEIHAAKTKSGNPMFEPGK